MLHKTEPRKFLGKTEGFTDKTERHFYQRMLKAYHAGHQFFHFGYETIMGQRQRKSHLVLQS